MGDTTTPILSLTKPLVGASQDSWGNKQNSNEDIVDSFAGTTNTQIAALWAAIQQLQNTVPVQPEAIGSIKFWPSITVFPPGFLICDGSFQATATWPALFAVIGFQWGGNGTTAFALPDLRGRVPVGLDQGTGRLQGQYGPDTVGQGGGAALVTLNWQQMPPHAHGGATAGAGDHSHEVFAYQADVPPDARYAGGNFVGGNHAIATNVAGFHGHSLTTDSQGGGGAHTNVQPGALGFFIIKAI